MSASIQWHVHCDVPGLRTLSHSLDGLAWSSVTVEGWLPFEDYVDALAAALTADTGDDWTGAVSAAGIVTLSTDDDPRYLRLESQSMADLLGFQYEDTAQSDTHTGATPGAGFIVAKSARWESPEPVTEGELTRYRHARFFSAPWGRGAVYEVACWLTGAELERMTSGPCAAGKVRVTPSGATAAMSSAAPGGWLDGWVVLVDADPVDRLEATYHATVRIMLPAATDRDTSGEALGDAVWGSLRRGYSIVHSLVTEGLTPRFVESITSLVEAGAARSQEAVLVIDGAGGVGSTIDRRAGVLVSDSLTFGFFDPTNALSYWQRPAASYTLAEDLAYSDTEVSVSELLSLAPSSGMLYIGKEVLTYSGKDTGSTPHKFTGITRGVYAPLYGYRAASPKNFRTLTSSPTVWEGRMVRLWAHLVDPWGRAVGVTFEDDWSIQVFLGSIDSAPKWGRGAWSFQAHTLERRLTSPVGYDAQARLEGRASDDPGDVFVWSNTGAQYDLNEYTDSTSAAVSTLYHNGSGALARLTLYQAVQKVLDGITIKCNTGADAVRSLVVTGAEDLPSGGVRVTIRMTTGADGLNFSVMPRNDSAAWLTQWTWGLPAGSESETTWDVQPRAMERTGTWSCFVREPAEDLGTEVVPSSGYITIEGDDGTVELAQVASKTAVDTVGAVYRLALTVRGEGGTPQADLSQSDRQVASAKYIAADPGHMALRIMEASGYGNRGAYDSLESGWGYAIPDDYIDEESFTSLEWDLDDLRVILAEPASLEDLLGGLFAIYGRHIGQVRSGRALKIGVVESLPVQGAYIHAVTDADLMLRDAASAEDAKENPNVIRVDGSTAALGGKEHQDKVVVRLTEPVQARGAVEWRFALRGLTPPEFFSLAPLLAFSLANRAQTQSVIKLRLVPWRDWLPGQIVSLNLTHPNLWDWSTGQMGHEGWARILGVSRDPETGIPTAIVLCDGQVKQGVLCPALAVTNVAGTVLTFGEDPRDHFEVGDTARLYNRGESAEYQDRVIASMTATTMTLTVAPSGWAAAGVTWATYPDDGDGSDVQDAHVHVDDGSTWE